MQKLWLLACLWILWQSTDQRDIQVVPGGSIGHIHWVYVAAFTSESACEMSDRITNPPGLTPRQWKCLPLGLTPREAGF